MKLLLHCCCGPCAVGSLPQFEEHGYQPFGYFYNPNIHPYQEHKARRLSFIELMERRGLPYLAVKDYPLEEWLRQVAPAPEQRCAYCYQSRLLTAAEFALNNGFEHFSTTPVSYTHLFTAVDCCLSVVDFTERYFAATRFPALGLWRREPSFTGNELVPKNSLGMAVIMIILADNDL